jgi:hypothetical protein
MTVGQTRWVNSGAIATTSPVPGQTLEGKWNFLHERLSRFAGRRLALNDEVYFSASATNYRNHAIARLLQSYGRIYIDRVQAVDLYNKQCSRLLSGIKMREKRLLPDRFWAEALSIKPALRTNGKRREAENGPAESTRIHPDKSLFTAFPSPLAERKILTISQFPISMPDRSSAQEIIEDRQPCGVTDLF